MTPYHLLAATLPQLHYQRSVGSKSSCRNMNLHDRGDRGVLDKHVVDVRSVGGTQMHTPRDAAKTMRGIGEIVAPRIALRVFPVEVAVRVGDADGNIVLLTQLDVWGDVDRERGTVDEVVTCELVVDEHLGAKAYGIKLQGDALACPVGRHVYRGVEPRYAHIVSCHTVGLSVPSPQLSLDSGRQLNVALLGSVEQLPSSCGLMNGERSNIDGRNIQLVAVPLSLGVERNVPP